MAMDEFEIAEALGDWGAEPGPLYLTLASAVDELARARRLEPGDRLPAERKLARALHVSRGTVVSAYDCLRRRGRLVTRQGSGTVVSGDPDEGRMSPTDPSGGGSAPQLGFITGTTPGDGVIDLKAAVWTGLDDLVPEDFILSPGRWKGVLVGSGYHPGGLTVLRELIAERLSGQGLPTGPDEVMITHGAQEAIVLICRMYLGNDGLAVSAELTYPGFMDIVHTLGGRVHTAPMDTMGVDVARLDRAVRRVRPEVVYLMPNVQNPTGLVMSDERRRDLEKVVTKWPDTVVIDDRTLAELTEDGHVPRPLGSAASEPFPNVLTVGSASKSLWGGLRIGWIRGPSERIAQLTRIGSVLNFGVSVAGQMIAAELLPRTEGLTPERRAELIRRRDAMVDALAERLPDWRFDVPRGGLSLWVRLPGVEARRFVDMAQRYGVSLAPGEVSSPDGWWRDHIRLPFGHPTGQLIEAVDRMADAWADLTHRAPNPGRHGVIV